MKTRGFTLVEMSIVLVIVGLLLTGILNGQSIIASAKAKDIISTADDLRTAISYFKQRYNYLPGDWPYTAGEINGITVAPAIPGNGDGKIDGTVNASGQAQLGSEVAELPWQLYNAGFLDKINTSDVQRRIMGSYGAIQVVSNATAVGLISTYGNAAVQNVIVFTNVPCNVLNEVDIKVDDANLTTGRGVASAACAGSTAVPYYGIAL